MNPQHGNSEGPERDRERESHRSKGSKLKAASCTGPDKEAPDRQGPRQTGCRQPGSAHTGSRAQTSLEHFFGNPRASENRPSREPAGQIGTIYREHPAINRPDISRPTTGNRAHPARQQPRQGDQLKASDLADPRPADQSLQRTQRRSQQASPG